MITIFKNYTGAIDVFYCLFVAINIIYESMTGLSHAPMINASYSIDFCTFLVFPFLSASINTETTNFHNWWFVQTQTLPDFVCLALNCRTDFIF